MKRKALGYIIGSWGRDDFFLGAVDIRGSELRAFYRDPGQAMRFRDTAKAQWVIDHLGRPDLYVCKLFDAGKRWWVEWPCPPGAPPSPSC